MKAPSHGRCWWGAAGGLLPLLGAPWLGWVGDSRWRSRPWYSGSWSPHCAGMLHNGVFRAASVTLCWCQPWLFTMAASQALPNGAERLSRALPRSLPGGELSTERCWEISKQQKEHPKGLSILFEALHNHTCLQSWEMCLCHMQLQMVVASEADQMDCTFSHIARKPKYLLFKHTENYLDLFPSWEPDLKIYFVFGEGLCHFWKLGS